METRRSKRKVKDVKKKYDENEDTSINEDYKYYETNYFVQKASHVPKSKNILNKTITDFNVSEEISLKDDIINYYETNLFPRIFKYLYNGKNVILYSLGSKIILLESFLSTWLKNEYYLKIEGYFNEMKLKTIMCKIAEFLDLENFDEETLDLLEMKDEFKYKNSIKNQNEEICLKDNYYIVVHSLDFLLKYDSKIINFFTKLSTKKNINILASVDSSNFNSIFDSDNFIYLETPTYQSYFIERSCQILSNKNTYTNGENNSLESVNCVYKSLTNRAKKILENIFTIWLEHLDLKKNLSDLDEENTEETNGLNFNKFYRKAKENFWATSENDLKAQLVELEDHHITKTQKINGVNTIKILISEIIIREFLKNKNS